MSQPQQQQPATTTTTGHKHPRPSDTNHHPNHTHPSSSAPSYDAPKRRRVEPASDPAAPSSSSSTTTAPSTTNALLLAPPSSHQQTVAAHYNARHSQGQTRRQNSPIYRMRCMNNWVKSVLINKYLQGTQGARVLDICSGKGGDMLKWLKSSVSYVLFADHADVSVRESVERYNGMLARQRRGSPAVFQANFMVADVHRARLAQAYPAGFPQFDLASCQFSLHYSFETRERAEGFMQNVAENLRPGGLFVGTIPDANVLVRRFREMALPKKRLDFGNDKYRVTFQERFAKGAFPKDEPFGIGYEFWLQDAIDACTEFLVPFDTLQQIADQFGLELVMKANFDEFFYEHERDPDYHALLSKLRVFSDQTRETISTPEWEISTLYLAFAFRKRDDMPAAPALGPTEAAAAAAAPKLQSLQRRQEERDIVFLAH